jgi:hypothetical protein
MSATVYAAARYGVVDDDTATGLHLASFSTNSEVDEAFALNHGGSTIGYSMYNDRATVDVSGVVAVKATGLALNLASVLSLANVTADSLNTNTGIESFVSKSVESCKTPACPEIIRGVLASSIKIESTSSTKP